MYWITIIRAVDLDTGEEIGNEVRKRDYLVIRKHKKIKYNEIRTQGTIQFFYECRRKPEQGKFQF